MCKLLSSKVCGDCSSCCCCCTPKAKLIVIIAWIQIIVFSIPSCLVIFSIFHILTKSEVLSGFPATLCAYYSSMAVTVPVHLSLEILIVVSLLPKKDELILHPDDKTGYTGLVICFSILLFFLLPAVATGICLLRGILDEKALCIVRIWMAFAAVWFILSVMEIVAGGYINGVFGMLLFAVAICIVHRAMRRRIEFMSRIV